MEIKRTTCQPPSTAGELQRLHSSLPSERAVCLTRATRCSPCYTPACSHLRLLPLLGLHPAMGVRRVLPRGLQRQHDPVRHLHRHDAAVLVRAGSHAGADPEAEHSEAGASAMFEDMG